MKNIGIIGAFAILIALGAAIGLGALSQQDTFETRDVSQDLPRYPLSEVQLHDNENDCWMAVDGKVYDVTAEAQAGDHPGGQQSLLSGCGTEVTEAFNSIHSNRAKAELQDFLIGTLE